MISYKITIMWEESPERGGDAFKKNCIEVTILNSFCLEKMVKPSEHLQ